MGFVDAKISLIKVFSNALLLVISDGNFIETNYNVYMKWYRLTLNEYELKKQFDKKLIKDFIAFLIKLDTPVGLAMHTLTSTNSTQNEIIYYFSTPDRLTIELQTLLTAYSISEISEPNLTDLNTVLGTIE